MGAVRRFSESIHVRWDSEARDGSVPVQFIWRGRLYVVQTVLEHWRERSAWWEHAAVAAVHGDVQVRRDSSRDTPRDIRALGAAEPRRVLEIGDLEREVWRVEARAGRHADVGVYDLARPVPIARPALVTVGAAGTQEVPGTSTGAFMSEPTDTSAENAWQLLRVSD